MKYLLIAFVLLLSGCGEKTYTEKELKAYLSKVDCKGYPDKKDFSDVDNKQLKKASIQKCQSEIFYKKDAIKKSEKKEW